MRIVIRDIFLKQILNQLNLYKDFPSLPERKKKLKNVISLFTTYTTKKTHKSFVHIKALKQALNQGLMLKKST